MRFHDASFFCDKESKPQIHIEEDLSDPKDSYPICIHINDSDGSHTRPSVTIWMNRRQLDLFVNSVVRSYEQLSKPPELDAEASDE